ncbi:MULTISPECIES: hypothetical protein [unclassified Beijerinckia]|uniref:hypothetical protein n=1 Tax=unclassified Beijerinckia TaxID=2638183 RepID=UPI00089537D6|nr:MULTISPECIES: hypothetical protein [unclassified Beijerinckia]MDH7797156.1 hypothetical protein [Beijerinckia sp. GAS462]SEC74417.1 hypothetical protein SAMN05443249_3448 [Beijerinckia sp. 28-YEA-48]
MPTPQQSTEWLAGKLRGHANIEAVDVISEQVIHAVRRQFEPFNAGVVSRKLVELSHVEQFVRNDLLIDYVVNIPRLGEWHPTAAGFLKVANIPYGDMSSFYAEIGSSEILGMYVPRDILYLEKLLRSHKRVTDFDPINERVYQVARRGLPSLKVTVIESYELTAEKLLATIERYGDFDVVLTGPLDRPTDEAWGIAQVNGIEFFKTGEFLARLNK